MPSDEELPQFRLRADDGDDAWAPAHDESSGAPRRPTYQLPVQPRIPPPADPPPVVGPGQASTSDGIAVVGHDATDAPVSEVEVGDGVNWRPVLAVVVAVVVVVAAVGAVNSLLVGDGEPFRETRPYIDGLASDRVFLSAGPADAPAEQWRSELSSGCRTSSVHLVGDVLLVSAFAMAPELVAFDGGTGEELWTIELEETSAGIHDLGGGRFLSVQPNSVSVRSLLNGAEIIGTERARDDGVFVRGDRIVVMRVDETVVHDHDLTPTVTLERFGRGSFVGDAELYDISAGVVRSLGISDGELRWSVEVASAETGVELDDVVVILDRSGGVTGLDHGTGEIVFQRDEIDAIIPMTRRSVGLQSGGATVEIVDPMGSTRWTLDGGSAAAITNGPPVVVAFEDAIVLRDERSGERIAEFEFVVGASARGIFVQDENDATIYRNHALADGEESWRIAVDDEPCVMEAAGDALVVVDADGVSFWR